MKAHDEVIQQGIKLPMLCFVCIMKILFAVPNFMVKCS